MILRSLLIVATPYLHRARHTRVSTEHSTLVCAVLCVLCCSIEQVLFIRCRALWTQDLSFSLARSLSRTHCMRKSTLRAVLLYGDKTCSPPNTCSYTAHTHSCLHTARERHTLVSTQQDTLFWTHVLTLLLHPSQRLLIDNTEHLLPSSMTKRFFHTPSV